MTDIIVFPAEEITDGLEPGLEKEYATLHPAQKEMLEKVAVKLGVRSKALFSMCVRYFVEQVEANNGVIPLNALPSPEQMELLWKKEPAKPENITPFQTEAAPAKSV